MAVRVLAFDTSADLTSVAVCDGDCLLAENEDPNEEPTARHAEVLLPRIEACLATAGLALADIDVIGVGAGPGSFTGVRVGVATAKGLGLALAKPVCPVVSLHALAHQAADRAEWLVPCLDAFKGELFAALYRSDASGLTIEIAPFHAEPDEVRQRLSALGEHALAWFGTGLARYADALFPGPHSSQAWRRLDASFDRPRARAVAAVAKRAFERGEIPSLASVAPVYLRDSDAQLPKTPLRLT